MLSSVSHSNTIMLKEFTDVNLTYKTPQMLSEEHIMLKRLAFEIVKEYDQGRT